jgi:DNA-binding transcriptional regulator GbsR (MarR family)
MPIFDFMAKTTIEGSKYEQQLRQQVVDFFSNAVQVVGLPRSVGQIYGYLFWSEAAVEMETLSRDLGISLGSVSQGLKQLRQFGAIRAIRPAGERRDQFEAVAELRPLVRGYIGNQIRPHIDNADHRIEEIEHTFKQEPLSEFQQERMKRLKKWQQQARLLLPILEKAL